MPAVAGGSVRLDEVGAGQIWAARDIDGDFIALSEADVWKALVDALRFGATPGGESLSEVLGAQKGPSASRAATSWS
jgi:hypothetical protein